MAIFFTNFWVMDVERSQGIMAVLFSSAIVTIFTKDQRTWDSAAVGFRIFAVNFLFSGINVVSSGFLQLCPMEKYLH